MFRGILMASSDPMFINQAMANGCVVVYVGDTTTLSPMDRDRMAIATALFPDYKTLAAQIEGNMQEFYSRYIQILSEQPAIEFFAVMLAALYGGKNVVMFFPPEAGDLEFIQVLLEFIRMNFGITPQTKSTQYMYDIKFNTRNAELMYLNNLISPQDFVLIADKLDSTVLTKLVYDIKPYVANPNDINDYMIWFNHYKKAMMDEGKPLTAGIQYAGKE